MEKFDVEDSTFKHFVKHGVNSKANKESLIALYLPENNYKKTHYYEFPIIKEMKWRNGAKTKYEIPQFINDIPDDFPFFCTIKEAGAIKNYQNKLKKKEEKIKNKSKPKSKENKVDKKNNNNNNNNNISELDEPIPNESHKYCHLCKKTFDNYLRHINSKIHKDNTNKLSDKIHDIKNIFKRINVFWENKKDNKDISKEKEELKEHIIITDENVENADYRLKILSQFNENVREGCKAKKKILIGQNSQLSTAQSFPVIPPKKRKKNDIKSFVDRPKEKRIKSNASIDKFLINGEFINGKKLNKDKNAFDNNYYN